MKNRILSKNEIQSIYNQMASAYDVSLLLFKMVGFRLETYRKKAIENLQLKRGETVVDLGCGTGLNFKMIHEKVGKNGKIIGVDLSKSMLEKAKDRTKRNQWHNIDFNHIDMADFKFTKNHDAVLSTMAMSMSPHYDKIFEKAALNLNEGKRISIFELQKPQNWPDWLIRIMVKILSSYGTRYEHTKRTPYKSIERHYRNSSIQNYYFDAVCLASGIV